MRASVILTVRNEAGSIIRLLDSLAAQSRRPDEVVVCDGGSTDGTLAALEAEAGCGRLPLKVILRPGSNISQGRNAAIAEAHGEIIASTDAGVVLERDWLANLIAPFEAGGDAVAVVAGFFLPDPHTAFEVAMGATVLPQLADIRPESFLPSSRSVAFRKTAWKQVDGYPEWLDYCEDLIFDLALSKLGPFVFAPNAIAHFRPRGSLGAFFRQYYHYARGDGKADLWRKRHAIRYLTYLVGAPGIGLAGLLISPWLWLIYLAGAATYTATPYRRLAAMWQGMRLADKLYAALLVPVIRVTGDIAKMAGYPVGLVWRLRNRAEAGRRVK